MASKKRFRSNKLWWLSVREKIVFLAFLAVFSLISPRPHQGEVLTASFPEFPVMKREPLAIPKPAAYPVNTTGVEPPADVSAYGVMVMDAHSGVPMYARNETEALSPASTTKVMTALVALDLYKPDDIVTFGVSTISGQVMDLLVGEQMTVENLLYGMLIHSGNDAAFALANYHPQGFDAFIAAMNLKAQHLALLETHFTNPAGYDDPAHKMSARDLARLGKYAMQNSTIAKMVALPQITVPDVTYTIYHPLKNVNQLLGKVPGVAGIKTGWTQEAGENLITQVTRNGKTLIIVTLKSKDRFADTTKLIDWAYANHQWVTYGI